jgi:hypothetical protein
MTQERCLQRTSNGKPGANEGWDFNAQCCRDLENPLGCGAIASLRRALRNGRAFTRERARARAWEPQLRAAATRSVVRSGVILGVLTITSELDMPTVEAATAQVPFCPTIDTADKHGAGQVAGWASRLGALFGFTDTALPIGLWCRGSAYMPDFDWRCTHKRVRVLR